VRRRGIKVPYTIHFSPSLQPNDSNHPAGVIAQIFISSFLTPGGTSGTAIDSVGGHYPPHIRADVPANLLRCDDRIAPLYADIQNATLKEAAGVSAMAQGLVSFNSPVPRATWDSEAFKGRIAFVRTLKDAAVPLHIQQKMIDGMYYLLWIDGRGG
jgi:hypothetical protein